jgi:hypothetical protein
MSDDLFGGALPSATDVKKTRPARPVHHCHARGCEVRVPPKMFMCKRHWFTLPKPMRDAIWATYVPGQEITKTPTAAYLDNALAAIEWLAQKEGK